MFSRCLVTNITSARGALHCRRLAGINLKSPTLPANGDSVTESKGRRPTNRPRDLISKSPVYFDKESTATVGHLVSF
jgi:hypothetical protein